MAAIAGTTQTMDEPLERLVRHVIEARQPLEIWLFGSRAENRARPTSDYDLLVVMPDGTPEIELDPVRAWRLGWEARVTADIIPCTRSEFDEEKDEIDSLPRAAALRGRKVYEGHDQTPSAISTGSRGGSPVPNFLGRVVSGSM
jgi:predicted nucleotidyltransferase